jgi:YgiT-type zinc finger domain-containing protein
MMKANNTEIICDVCGKNGARILHLSKSYGKGKDLLVVENVPIISCPQCGESYLTAKTLREIENIKRNRSNFAVERNVAVAVFV